MKSLLLMYTLCATSLFFAMENAKNLTQLKQQAAALSAQLRQQRENSSREDRSSYKSFQAQELEQLRLQIQAYEVGAFN